MQCCAGGGQNAQTAGQNRVSCSMTLANTAYNATLNKCKNSGSYSINSDTTVELTYYPCHKYTGNVNFVCTALQANDDYSGSGPGSVLSQGTLTFAYTVIPCVSCSGGTCDPVLGCICPTGKFGPNCVYGGTGSSLAYSSFVVLGSLLVALIARF